MFHQRPPWWRRGFRSGVSGKCVEGEDAKDATVERGRESRTGGGAARAGRGWRVCLSQRLPLRGLDKVTASGPPLPCLERRGFGLGFPGGSGGQESACSAGDLFDP